MFNPNQFDPSKMDPKLMMELSRLIQELPGEKLSRMQTLMHNMMAGFDVRKDLEEFEKTLPPGFRERMMSIMASQGFSGPNMPQDIEIPSSYSPTPVSDETSHSAKDMNLREARLTILRAVAGGSLPPEEAEKLLFG